MLPRFHTDGVGLHRPGKIETRRRRGREFPEESDGQSRPWIEAGSKGPYRSGPAYRRPGSGPVAGCTDATAFLRKAETARPSVLRSCRLETRCLPTFSSLAQL